VTKAATRQSLLAKPKTLAIVLENSYRGCPAIAKNEGSAGEGIALKLRPTQLCEAVDPLAKIDRIDCN